MKRNIEFRFYALVMIGCLSIVQPLRAQQDAQYSMYMFNMMAINPAYAGSRETLSITGLYRQQWVGIDGAPKTGVLTAHAPLLNEKIGLGISIASDNISIVNTIHLEGSFAYRILMEKGTLSFGISGSMNQYRARFTDLTVRDPSDPAFMQNADNVFNPNVGAGIYYYSPRFFAGVSAPHLLNTSLNDNFRLENNRQVARQFNHYFATTGVTIPLSEHFEFVPSVLLKYVRNSPFQADLNAGIRIRKALYLAASYRTRYGVLGIIEYTLSENLRLGYGYDYALNSLGTYTSGSHEIMVNYELGRATKYLTPRRMNYY